VCPFVCSGGNLTLLVTEAVRQISSFSVLSFFRNIGFRCPAATSSYSAIALTGNTEARFLFSAPSEGSMPSGSAKPQQQSCLYFATPFQDSELRARRFVVCGILFFWVQCIGKVGRVKKVLVVLVPFSTPTAELGRGYDRHTCLT
jgi:hypothetical protein